MKTKKILTRRSRPIYILVAFAFSLTAFTDTVHTKQLDLNCPPPTVQKGNQCVLESDVVLDETLELFSDTKLNCQGHKITPAAEGILGDANSRSQPELGIFLNGVQNIQIQECVIEGFDHGILAINSKVTAELEDDPGALALLRNKIHNNTIKARFVPVHLVLADNFVINNNIITWLTRGGAGVYIHNDSAINEIKNNTIMGDFSASTQGAVLFPGPTAAGSIPTNRNSNPVFNSGHSAILVHQVLGPHPHLFNAVIGGDLFQFEDTLKDNLVLEPNDEGVTADTLVEGNVILFLQENKTEFGASFSTTLRSTVRNNTVGRGFLDVDGPDGGRFGSIRAGAIRPVPPAAGRQFPGTCSLDSSRKCLSNFDCNIPGIDTMSLGTCNLPAQIHPTWYAQDMIIENNTIFGPFHVGISMNGNNPIIKKNNIRGPLWPALPGQTQGGIVLEGKYTIETAIVTENTVEDCSTALRMDKAFQGLSAAFFGAYISLNNFTGYDTAILASNDFIFDVPSEISVGGKGNHWGLTCAEGGFDPSKVLRVNGTVNPNVVDSHPYGEPIAETPEEELPMTCF